ncbi:MAG TPA: hypothetical protein VIU81_10425 [Gaiellaceae bacterium]
MTAFVLVSDPLCASVGRLHGGAVDLPVVRWIAANETRALRVRQFDISDPVADRRLRDADEFGDLPDRAAFLTSQTTRLATFICFHI